MMKSQNRHKRHKIVVWSRGLSAHYGREVGYETGLVARDPFVTCLIFFPNGIHKR